MAIIFLYLRCFARKMDEKEDDPTPTKEEVNKKVKKSGLKKAGVKIGEKKKQAEKKPPSRIPSEADQAAIIG